MRPLSEHRKRLAHDLAEPAIRTLLRDLRLRNLGRGSVTVVNDADYAQAFGIAQGLFYAGVNDFAPNDGRDKFFRRIQEAVEAEWMPQKPKDWIGRKVKTNQSLPSNGLFGPLPVGAVGVIRSATFGAFEVSFPSQTVGCRGNKRAIYRVSTDHLDIQVAGKGDYRGEVWVRTSVLDAILAEATKGRARVGAK